MTHQTRNTYLSEVDLTYYLDIHRGLGAYDTLIRPDDVIVWLSGLHLEENVALRALIDYIYRGDSLALLFILSEDHCHGRVQSHILCPILL